MYIYVITIKLMIIQSPQWLYLTLTIPGTAQVPSTVWITVGCPQGLARFASSLCARRAEQGPGEAW